MRDRHIERQRQTDRDRQRDGERDTERASQPDRQRVQLIYAFSMFRMNQFTTSRDISHSTKQSATVY